MIRLSVIGIPISLLLAACATTQAPEPVVRTVEVRIPFDDPACAREALARLGPGPVYPDTDEALRNAPNVFAGVQLLSAGRLLRIAREAAWRAAVEACAGR
jgi:hypothetical protein